MAQRYQVTLELEEHEKLVSLTRTVAMVAKLFANARALLLCDKCPEGPDPPWTVAKTVDVLGASPRTIEHLKRRFVEAF